MQCAEQMGCEDSIIKFVLPLGTTVNMNGTALYEATTVIFIAQVNLCSPCGRLSVACCIPDPRGCFLYACMLMYSRDSSTCAALWSCYVLVISLNGKLLYQILCCYFVRCFVARLDACLAGTMLLICTPAVCIALFRL